MRIPKEKVYTLISPRLLVLITTLDMLDSIDALPADFITPVIFNPPIIMVSIKPETNTYQNIMEKKEFVINILSMEYLSKVVGCDKHLPKGFNKLEDAGLHWYSSEKIKTPRVKEAKAWLECKLIGGMKVDHILKADHNPIFAEVIAAEVSDDIVVDDKVDFAKLNPILHIGGKNYVSEFKIVKGKNYD
jgi:flavin reductase (DIM6/NTAB) family NADH-FMN oxidoreductase RutF